MDLAERERRAFALLQEFKRRPRYLQWLLVNSGRRFLLLKVDEISWVEAQGNYVRVHHDRGSHLIRETISALESQLNPSRFLRIHRSAIVQISRIEELRQREHGEYRVIMNDGAQLMMTRTYRPNLWKAVNREKP